jgi:hypothetical protein
MHTDLPKGLKAELISFEDLVEAGSAAEAPSSASRGWMARTT